MRASVCGCISGPPPGGICNACGAWGVGYRPPYEAPLPPQPSPWPPGVHFVPAPMTGEEIRKIVREELERVLQQLGKTRE